MLIFKAIFVYAAPFLAVLQYYSEVASAVARPSFFHFRRVGFCRRKVKIFHITNCKNCTF